MIISNMNKKLNKIIARVDKCDLAWIGILIIAIILLPIFILKEGAVFPIHDQLDETILNYVFTARYFGASRYEAMMCGAADSSGLKPFAPLFVPLYCAFSPFVAFVIQFGIVICTAWFGAYGCVKKITKSSIAAFLSASVFALLPFRSVYGNQLSGTTLLILCILILKEKEETKRKKILAVVGLIFYAASTSFVLVGYAVIMILGISFLIELILKKKFDFCVFVTAFVLGFTYVAFNLDIVKQVLDIAGVTSHREEFVITGANAFELLREYLFEGVALNESFHKFIYIAFCAALLVSVFAKDENNDFLKPLLITFGTIVCIAIVAAFLGSETVGKWKNAQSGMMRSFQMQRFYLLLPGLWYLLLGISLGIIIKNEKIKCRLLNLILAGVVLLPTVIYVGKNKDCIFYQNVNQINNSDITGYITWEKLYSEELMSEIENAIGKDMTTYRVGSIGISPVVSLMHGFYTIDGYSNNYSLDYKHLFANIVSDELNKNDYVASYFYDWGNRCCLYYHEWGNANFIGKQDDVTINDFSFNIDAMKALNCQYLFTAGEIKEAESLGMKLIGVFETDTSYWRIWVYEL